MPSRPPAPTRSCSRAARSATPGSSSSSSARAPTARRPPPTRSSPSSTGSWPAPSSTWARSAARAGCARPTPGTSSASAATSTSRPPCRRPRRSRRPGRRCAATSSRLSASLVTPRAPRVRFFPPRLSEMSIDHVIGGQLTPRSLDAAIAALAERQHGVVERAQLLAARVGRRAIDHRLATGRLHPIHRGVYAVGHSVLSTPGRWTASVLAAGPGAVLSHRAAAALWAIRAGTTIEVTAPTRRRRPGIIIHCASLAADERGVRDGIPTTTVARTIFAPAAVADRQSVDTALHEAEYQGLTDVVPLIEL